MAKVETFACDICGVQKKDANHWWEALSFRVGVLVFEWGKSQDAMEALGIDALSMDAIAHLCGEAHVHEWLSKHLTGKAAL